MGNGFAGGLAGGLGLGMAIGEKFREGKLRGELSKAAEVNPESFDASSAMTETTQKKADSVYDTDTGQYLPKYMDSSTPSGMTDFGLSQNMSPDGDKSATDRGLMPAFKSETTKRYRMGGREQDTPFSQEQIDAQRFRNQADVYSKFGHAEKAATLQGLAKSRDDDATTRQIREGAMAGLKNTNDMRDDEKILASTKAMYEAAMKLNRPDLASAYYNEMNKNREAAFKNSFERADRIYRATGNLSGFFDHFNKHIANGVDNASFVENPDGSVTGKFDDRVSGRSYERVLKKEEIPGLIASSGNLDEVRKLEAKVRERMLEDQLPSSQAKTDLLRAQADYYKGAKTTLTSAQAEAAAARANGSGRTNIGQQRFDAQQFQGFLKEHSSFYELPDPMGDGKYVTNRIARDAFAAAARQNSERAQQTFQQFRDAAEAEATDDSGNVDPKKMNAAYLKRVNAFSKRLNAPPPPVGNDVAEQKQNHPPATKKHGTTPPSVQQRPETPQEMLARQQRERAMRGETLSEAGFGLKRLIGAVPPSAPYVGHDQVGLQPISPER